MAELSKQKKKTWVAFSEYIRTRDCKEYGKNHPSAELMCECVTCKRVYPYSKLQAGHFIQGRTNGVLFDERGVHAQCVGCNMFKGGLIEDYYPFMLEKYGQEVIDDIKKKRLDTIKFSVKDLEEMEVLYKQKTKDLLNQ
jgi:hypothetical protein